jgi:hypothetical protein
MAEQLTGQNSTKTPKHTRPESAAGIRVNPGPYEGVVKDNIDATRTGRLTVWIAAFGTDPDDPTGWRTVRYCSPFWGQTSVSKRSKTQDFSGGSPHTYGMWFVPPDIDNRVLCIFAEGKAEKGYWFGCIPSEFNAHMVPGISSGSWHGGGPEPLVEYNPLDPAGKSTESTFYSRAKTIHDYQNQVWSRQGLLGDPDRGPGISSAFRETPSRVFGISTPGPELVEPSGTDIATDGTSSVDKRVVSRQGGHQFVMDDGTADGKSQLIRLRTSNGNMLLMNDSAGFIYMINSAGSAWFEMDKAGNVRIYSGGKFEVHGTSGITLETPGPLSLSGSTVSITAKSSLTMSGMSASLTGMTSCSVGGMGSTSLSGSAVGVKALMCATVSGMMGVGISGACVTLNCKPPMPPSPSMPAPPGPEGPTAEPYMGHHSGATNSPVGSPSYGASSGVNDGQAGKYGAAGSFGINPSTPGYYGVYTNANGPIKFNTGFQGGLLGQAANQGATATLNQFDRTSVLYTDVNLKLPVAASGFAVNTKDPNVAAAAGLTQGEKQNNPGDLIDRINDPFAIGQANGLNVYATPEDGIAALSLALDLIQADGYTKISDVIQQYVARKGKVA